MNAEVLTTHRRWRDYLEITKPKVVVLLTFTATAGMLLAAEPFPPWTVLIFGSIGIALVSAAAAALNQVVDQRIDAVMARTRNRPLPRGQLETPQAMAFAALLGTTGIWLLLTFTNLLCAILTFASMLGYAVIYTMFLKRATPQNIVIGGASGAAPPLLGWIAVTGQFEPGAAILFAIVFVWTPPHFWALAIHRREDYAKVDMPMLPVTHGVELTRLHILLYTVLLFVFGLLPYLAGMSGLLYLIGAVILGGRFLWWAYRMYRRKDDSLAMPTFGYSIVYLFALFGVLLADHYLLMLMP
ncbi:MAG: heme o synthase [Gammaproteobacteria bacterium]|nr:heme o synthase [Gammaproteobacteria bacterium]MCY4166462.1 heme o synthase [Gammaproteobacteria bacterium]MCY4339935.1 heme o synthase [Gammaproteobacteria bacterium]